MPFFTNRMNEEIKKYVTDERARGVSDADIKKELLTKGWKEEDVNAGLGVVVASAAPVHTSEFSFMHMFEGRLGRWQCFVASMVCMLALMVLVMIVGVLGGDGSYMFGGIIYLLSFPIFVALSVRRLHDMDWSGWLVLLTFVPLANIFMGLCLLFKKGTDGPNQYGPPQPDREIWATVLNT